MFSAKELTRKVSSPTEDDWQKLKRVGRYPITTSCLVLELPCQAVSEKLVVYNDADHAGFLRTPESTSGGVIV